MLNHPPHTSRRLNTPPGAAAIFADGLSGKTLPARQLVSGQSRLTNREKDVLTWVARGKTSGEIALILAVSERTVNFHCEQAMKRLDVVNRTHAVAKAIIHQLISV